MVQGIVRCQAFLGIPSLNGQGSTVGNFVEHSIKIINSIHLQVNFKMSLIIDVNKTEKGHDLFIKKKGPLHSSNQNSVCISQLSCIMVTCQEVGNER